MRILIDADGCPVTRLAVEIAENHGIKAIVFCDTSHIFEFDKTEVVTVSKGADSVDFALVNRCEKGDVAVTQDYGLAAMVLSKGGIPITQNGFVINNFNIDTLLQTRHISKKARMNNVHLKGPSKRTAQQDKDFENSLEALILKQIF